MRYIAASLAKENKFSFVSLNADIAQLVERVHGKDEVTGSTPVIGSAHYGAPNETSMSQDNMIKLECSVCKRVNFFSTKNKKILKNRLELSKFCKHCKKHTAHKETK